MKEKVFEETKKIFPKPDYIVNLYDMTPEWASKRVLNILGYNEFSEIKGKSIVDMLAFETDEQKRAAISEAIGLVGTKVSEGPFKSKNGSIVMMKFKLTRIDVDGEPYEIATLVDYRKVDKK